MTYIVYISSIATLFICACVYCYKLGHIHGQTKTLKEESKFYGSLLMSKKVEEKVHHLVPADLVVRPRSVAFTDKKKKRWWQKE